MTADEHQRLRERLPWYASGTLAPAEAAPLREHLDGCAACRAELAQCRWLADGLRSRDDPPWAPSAAGFARLMAAVDEAERRAAPAHGAAGFERPHGQLHERRRAWLRSWLGGSPPAVRWALATQAALIVVLGAAWVAQAPPPQYGTLSDPAPRVIAPGAAFHVVFSDDITEREWRELLFSVGGRIVQGPSALGVYIVVVAPAQAPEAIARLRSHPKVRLAEPMPAPERP
jgi:anti-sigma factor RsiW